MRVLLLGAGGMLAQDLTRQAPQAVDVIPLTHRELDVTDQRAVERAVADTRPEVILNCAGYTNVDRAESEREHAFAVNQRGPEIIGRAAAASSHPLVLHFSTDYVFDGLARRPYQEDDPTSPLGAYGASKLGGERALARSGARYLIVRTSWLFGAHGRSFPRTMWERATGGKATRVVNDQVGRPTYTVDLARATWTLIGTRPAGSGKSTCVLHVANSGEATWFEIAQRVFAAAGALDLLTACTSAEYPTPAKRPAYSVLDTTLYHKLQGGPLPPWQEGLDRFLAEVQ